MPLLIDPPSVSASCRDSALSPFRHHHLLYHHRRRRRRRRRRCHLQQPPPPPPSSPPLRRVRNRSRLLAITTRTAEAATRERLRARDADRVSSSLCSLAHTPFLSSRPLALLGFYLFRWPSSLSFSFLSFLPPTLSRWRAYRVESRSRRYAARAPAKIHRRWPEQNCRARAAAARNTRPNWSSPPPPRALSFSTPVVLYPPRRHCVDPSLVLSNPPISRFHPLPHPSHSLFRSPLSVMPLRAPQPLAQFFSLSLLR